MLKPNKINLVRRMGEDPARRQHQRGRLGLLLPFAALILVVLAAQLVYVFGVRANMLARRDSLQAYVYDAANLEEHRRVTALAGEYSALADQRDSLTAALEAFNTYPEAGKALFDAVYQAADEAGVTIEGFLYDRQGGGLQLLCYGPGPLSASQYADALAGRGPIAAAVCSGYSQAFRTAGGQEQAVYSFEIACTVDKEGN